MCGGGKIRIWLVSDNDSHPSVKCVYVSNLSSTINILFVFLHHLNDRSIVTRAHRKKVRKVGATNIASK